MSGRLAWLSKEQRDWFERFQHSSGPLREAIDAWDAAPADPVEVAVDAYVDFDQRGSLEEQFTVVLAALGVPQQPTPRDETS